MARGSPATYRGLEIVMSDYRTYRIFVCPNCGDGPETTAFIPGCGPRAIERGDNLRQCRECGFKGAYVALEVTPRMRWTGSMDGSLEPDPSAATGHAS
jgi:predicted RNA-binding Zn-ribbon protein involved in translation (DUF1610 family)